MEARKLETIEANLSFSYIKQCLNQKGMPYFKESSDVKTLNKINASKIGLLTRNRENIIQAHKLKGVVPLGTGQACSIRFLCNFK